MWTIVALLVMAIAVMLLMGVQDGIPENIRGLWDRPAPETPAQSVQAGGPGRGASVRTRVGKWSIVREGAQVEISQDLAGDWSAGALRYDAPAFAFTCYDRKLYARIATRLATTGAQQTTLRIDGAPAAWVRADGNYVYSPAPARLLEQLARRDTLVRFEMDFAELGARAFELDTRELSAAAQALPPACRAP